MIHIYTFAHKRPDFIEFQVRSFRAHLGEEFQFTIFNNAAFDIDPTNYFEIAKQGKIWGAEVVDVEKDPPIIRGCEAQETIGPMFNSEGVYHNPNVACAYPLCWAWTRLISKTIGNVCLIDSDIFLTSPIVLSDFLFESPFCFIPQFRKGAEEYAWNAFALLNLDTLPEPETLNWYCGKVNGVPVDVGGQTSAYFRAHPYLQKTEIRAEYVSDEGGLSFHPADYEKLYIDDKQFAVHHRSGSNWNGRSHGYLEAKKAWLIKLLEDSGA